jgi:colicin import membrane protein
MTTFLKQHAGALVFSVLLHLVLIGLLGVTLNFSLPRRTPTRLAIEAVVVDSTVLVAKQRQQEELQRQREADARRQRERKAAEDKRQRELVVKREADERARREAEVEEKRKAEAAAKRKAAEDKRKAAEDKRKAAEDKRKAEEAAKRKAAEDKREAEAAAKRKQEEAEKRRVEQQRQREEAELRAALAEEEELLALQQSDAMNQYQWQIQQRIERSWIRPPSARVGLSCELNVIQLPSGDVIDVRVGRCNGDAVVIRSLEAAVLRASPLPVPSDPRLYSRNLRMLFEPQQ